MISPTNSKPSNRRAWERDESPAWRAVDLYTSPYSAAKRDFAETVSRWTNSYDSDGLAILSAEHDVLPVWCTVTPYEKTVGDLGDDESIDVAVGRPLPDLEVVYHVLDGHLVLASEARVQLGKLRLLEEVRDREEVADDVAISTIRGA